MIMKDLIKKGLVIGIISLLVGTCSTASEVGNNSLRTIFVPDDYPTIQGAINHAYDGDRIEVRPGIYEENIIVDRMVDIIGSGSDVTFIDGSESGTVVTIIADGVTLTDFTIQNSGLHAIGLYIASHYNAINNNNITGNSVGLKLEASSGNQINDNIVSNNDETGVWLYRSHANSLTENIILNNKFDGVLINFSCIGNIFAASYIINNSKNGFSINQTSRSNSLFGNRISNNQNKGIEVTGASDGNYFYLNDFLLNGENAWDNSDNTWAKEAQGNYWDDYNGSDNDGNGIGDTPYDIPGGDNQDDYPLMETWTKNLPPLIFITLPDEDEWVSKIYMINGSADDIDGTIEFIEVKIDNGEWNTASGTNSWSYEWNTTTVEDGKHTIYARSRDNEDTLSIETVKTVNVDNNPPEVSIDRPKKGFLYIFGKEIWPTTSGDTKIFGIGGIDIEVLARDYGIGMNHVEFYINDVKKEDEYYSPGRVTCTWLWDETIFGQKRTIKVVAYDLLDNSVNTELEIIIWNLHLPSPP